MTDITSRSQCFLVYMAVMHQKYPERMPGMIAYMLTIVRTQQEFEDPGWRIHDHNYRLKAAASGNRDWTELDPIYTASVSRVRQKGSRPVPNATPSDMHRRTALTVDR